MLKIRLKLCGRKNLPFYKVVVVDSRKKRDGNVIEEVGQHNPRTKEVFLRRDRISMHLHKGAQLSDRVQYLLTLESNRNT
jgi:small subunit ribosomal protein S16